METTMNLVTCGKCGGSGAYRFYTTGRTEACYPCDGTGRVEPVAASTRPVRIAAPNLWRIETDLRQTLVNARAGRCEWAEVSGEDRACMYQPGQFSWLLDQVSPAAREAFRALGWPV